MKLDEKMTKLGFALKHNKEKGTFIITTPLLKMRKLDSKDKEIIQSIKIESPDDIEDQHNITINIINKGEDKNIIKKIIFVIDTLTFAAKVIIRKDNKVIKQTFDFYISDYKALEIINQVIKDDKAIAENDKTKRKAFEIYNAIGAIRLLKTDLLKNSKTTINNISDHIALITYADGCSDSQDSNTAHIILNYKNTLKEGLNENSETKVLIKVIGLNNGLEIIKNPMSIKYSLDLFLSKNSICEINHQFSLNRNSQDTIYSFFNFFIFEDNYVANITKSPKTIKVLNENKKIVEHALDKQINIFEKLDITDPLRISVYKRRATSLTNFGELAEDLVIIITDINNKETKITIHASTKESPVFLSGIIEPGANSIIDLRIEAKKEQITKEILE